MDRVEMINKYSQRKKNIATRNSYVDSFKYGTAVQTIACMAEKIAEVIKVGRACLDNGMCINGYERVNGYEDEKRNFYTDGIHHKVGFYGGKTVHGIVGEPISIEGVGIKNGGANGNTDLFVDIYGDVYAVNHDNGELCDIEKLNIECIHRFIQEFDGFEKRFYEYVDSVCEKMKEAEIDTLITKKMIERGYNQGLVTIRQVEDGVVCQIGQYWFNFDSTAEGFTVEEYRKRNNDCDIITAIYDCLEDFRKAAVDDDCYWDEYLYYYYYLMEFLIIKEE